MSTDPGPDLQPDPAPDAPLIAEREYRRLSPLTPVVRAPIVVLAFVGGSWQQLLDGDQIGTTALIILGLLAAGLVYGLASWIRTKYWIDDDELRVDKGVIARQSRRIRIDRLQGVDIVQPFLARFFGLAELRFDVASGSDREGSLAFLPHQEALALRATLLRRRDDLRHETGRPVVPSPRPEQERELARLDLGLLVASLVLSPETLITALAALAIGGLFLATGTFAIAGAIVPAAIGVALALGRRLTSFYGFRLTETPAGLHVSRGLTSLSSQTIALHRVQGLVLSEPWLWRPFGWARLEVSVAGYGASAEPDKAQPSSTLMPVAPKAECVALLDHVLGGASESSVTSVALSAPPSRAKWLAPLTYWWLAFGRDDRLVVSRRGLLVRRLDVVPLARVQSVRLEQGPLQRLLDLADLRIDSPPGPVRVHGHQRDALEARARGSEVVLATRSARRAS